MSARLPPPPPLPDLAADDFIEATTLGDLLLDAAARWPDGEALVFPDWRGSYGALAAAATAHARALLALGVAPGDHVGLLLPTCPEFVEAFFGIALAGAVAVPINARYRGDELAYVAANADLVAVLTVARPAKPVNFVERLREALPGLAAAPAGAPLDLEEAPKLRAIVLLNEETAPPGFTAGAAFMRGGDATAPASVEARRRAVRLRDIGLILYTSGTTSHPKGCLLSHEAIVRTAQALGVRYAVTGEDAFWSPLPLFHIAAILPLCTVFGVGGSYHTMRAFEAGQALDMLESERASVTYPCFAPFIADMIFHPSYAARDLSRIRLMNSNLAVQPEGFRDALRTAMPGAIQVGSYGLTEASGTVCTHGAEDAYDTRVERLGRPLPGVRVRIAREDGGEAAPGEVGEVRVRSPGLFDGYYKDPVKTAESLRDGWLCTGDLGSLDARGAIMFHGRTKDMLKVGGENVAAAEVEALIGKHPAVKLCQVVGAPHPRLTEVPLAFVELKPGQAAEAEEIIAFCRGKLAAFKVPRHVRFVDAWPMSASKIQKFVLLQAFLEETAEAGS